VAFGHLFTSAPTLHPREFELLQVLLSTRRRETSDEDAQRVLPHALGLINEFRLLIEAAVAVGALRGEEQDGSFDDNSLGRTIAWAGALNGALLVSNVATVPTEDQDLALMGDIFDGRRLALRVGRDLLAGWGAPAEQLAAAEEFVQQLRDADRIAVSGAAEVAEDGTVDLTEATAAEG